MSLPSRPHQGDCCRPTYENLKVSIVLQDMDGNLSILDGRHRIGALALLSEKAPDNFDLENILVEVFSSDTADSDAAEEIFVEINKSEPIKMVDMPGVAKAKDRKIISQAAAKLHEQYPTMFRPLVNNAEFLILMWTICAMLSLRPKLLNDTISKRRRLW